MRTLPAALAALALLAQARGPAQAQETGSPLPPITVRPSGIEDEGAAARERQERLMRRREESLYRFRHICTHCLNAQDGAATGPFHPWQALEPGRRPPP